MPNCDVCGKWKTYLDARLCSACFHALRDADTRLKTAERELDELHRFIKAHVTLGSPLFPEPSEHLHPSFTIGDLTVVGSPFQGLIEKILGDDA